MELSIPCFDPFKIAGSGQCFRMRRAGGNALEALAGGERVTIEALGGERFRLDCERWVFERFWRPYFDLDTDYSRIEDEASRADDALARAACRCHGLRILRQDPWETLVSFIISQRKSIPAIRTCVERLCERFGEPREAGGARYRAFPAPQALAEAGEDALRACGLGYRAPYVAHAAERVLTGALDLRALAALPNGELLSRLMEARGVGVKVASCVMLFGFHRMDASPVDVWIARVIKESYGGVSPFERYGENAGIFQQYLFYSKAGASL